VRDELSVLSAFLAVADERSFTRAAKRLNISTSGLSHAIRRLEEQIGVRLLTRTTRNVYFPSRRQRPAALSALIDTLRV
jgi:DNA-binding transcriptional LysR family regulator